MQLQLRKLVLILLVAMAVATPFMQLDSWDSFPVATDDLEMLLILNLCLIGMFFAFASILIKLFPAFFRSSLVQPLLLRSGLRELETIAPEAVLFGFTPPLRN